MAQAGQPGETVLFKVFLLFAVRWCGDQVNEGGDAGDICGGRAGEVFRITLHRLVLSGITQAHGQQPVLAKAIGRLAERGIHIGFILCLYSDVIPGGSYKRQPRPEGYRANRENVFTQKGERLRVVPLVFLVEIVEAGQVL